MASEKKFQIDMCHGPLFSKIVYFSIPLMVTHVMQLLFHAADLIVVGRFAPSEALAGVGATSGLTILVLNVFFGLSTGVNVLVARYTGAKDRKKVSKHIHTAAAVALYGGITMGIIGILVSKPVLQLMGTPENIIDKSALYMWIYCAGIPLVTSFNFGGAILRAVGDTRRPMLFMLISGFVNVILNLFFVIVCRMDVAGVALATNIANALSAYLVFRTLLNSNGPIRLFVKKIKIHRDELLEVMKIGLPSGAQGACFSLSNITIQSAVNSCGWQAVAGNTAAMSIEGLVYVSSAVFFYSSISFAGQNHGARKYSRIPRSFWYCMGCAVALSIITGIIFLALGRDLLGVFNQDPDIISWGMLRLKILLVTYWLCAMMDVVSGTLRGLGYSFSPMIVTVLGVCVLRILWVKWIFPINRTMTNLMISYPVSWFLVFAVNGLMLWMICRKMLRNARYRRFY